MRRLLRWTFHALAGALLCAQPSGLPAHTAGSEPYPATTDVAVGLKVHCAFGAGSVSICRGHVLGSILWVTGRSRFPWSEAGLHVNSVSMPPEVAEGLIEHFADMQGRRCFDFAGIVVGYDHLPGMGHRGIGVVLPAFWLRCLVGGLANSL